MLSCRVRRRLRQVSRLQTDIGKIQKHQELVGMAWGQKVSERPSLYACRRGVAKTKMGAGLAVVCRGGMYHAPRMLCFTPGRRGNDHQQDVQNIKIVYGVNWSCVFLMSSEQPHV